MEQWLLISFILLNLVFSIVILILCMKQKKQKEGMEELRKNLEREQGMLRKELGETTRNTMKVLGEMISGNLKDGLGQMENRLKTFEASNEQRLENIRGTVKTGLESMQRDNNEKLDKMRQTVDEKLQTTLENKMTQSFRLVNERLEQVYKGLGEMQSLAVGVGDLKKVLSNVKTRGILGELQLGAILREILSPEQYEENVATVPGSRNAVEFAVKLPGEDGESIYLPIDSKFPSDAYSDLLQAYEQGNSESVDMAAKALLTRLKTFAKDIRDKYIDPPYTTEFAIMFLPFEGLYAEAVNRGMVEELQRLYRVNVAGPSTMAALLNSLQMGFKTFAIQKRTGEVWKVLGAVKAEFGKFEKVLQTTQKRLEQANTELDTLVGVRTRAIQKQLSKVEKLEESSAEILLEENDFFEE